MRAMNIDEENAVDDALSDAKNMAAVVLGWMVSHLGFDYHGPKTLSSEQVEQANWAMSHLESLIVEADRIFHANEEKQVDADRPA